MTSPLMEADQTTELFADALCREVREVYGDAGSSAAALTLGIVSAEGAALSNWHVHKVPEGSGWRLARVRGGEQGWNTNPRQLWFRTVDGYTLQVLPETRTEPGLGRWRGDLATMCDVTTITQHEELAAIWLLWLTAEYVPPTADEVREQFEDVISATYAHPEDVGYVLVVQEDRIEGELIGCSGHLQDPETGAMAMFFTNTGDSWPSAKTWVMAARSSGQTEVCAPSKTGSVTVQMLEWLMQEAQAEAA